MNDDSIATHMHCHVLSVLLTGPEKKKKKKKKKKERHLFSIKMKEIIKKLKIKVPGRVRKGFIVPIRWHPFNNLN